MSRPQAGGDTGNNDDVVTPGGDSPFAPQYNEVQSGNTNPLFTDFAQTAGAPDGTVVVPRGAEQPMIVADGQQVMQRGDGTGNTYINAEVVNIYYGGREVPPQVARFEQGAAQVYDAWPQATMRPNQNGRTFVMIGGDRPYFDQGGQVFDQWRHPAGGWQRPGWQRPGWQQPVSYGGDGAIVVDHTGPGRSPTVFRRDSTTYGGNEGVVFQDNTTVVGDGSGTVISSSNGGITAREWLAFGMGVLNSRNLPVILNRGGQHRGVHNGGWNNGGWDNGGWANGGWNGQVGGPWQQRRGPYYGTPPFVPGGRSGDIVVSSDGGPVPNVYDRRSTTYGGNEGVIFSDNTTVVGNGGIVASDNGGISGRDVLATIVGVVNSRNLPVILGRDGGGSGPYRGGNDNFYNQRAIADARRAEAMARSDAMRQQVMARVNRRHNVG